MQSDGMNNTPAKTPQTFENRVGFLIDIGDIRVASLGAMLMSQAIQADETGKAIATEARKVRATAEAAEACAAEMRSASYVLTSLNATRLVTLAAVYDQRVETLRASILAVLGSVALTRFDSGHTGH
jgi:hypothetical protein